MNPALAAFMEGDNIPFWQPIVLGLGVGIGIPLVCLLVVYALVKLLDR